MSEMNPLELQLEAARRTISADGYPVSIGEITNMYREGELIIRPEFQRFFRWTTLQRSRLIESLLLGLPLPSIFVAQREDGKWELVDGLQRISTILQLQGELRGPTAPVEPLILQGTKYLPALEGRHWQSDDESLALTEAQRLDVKRSKIDVKIIRRDSSEEAKYDLFQRLNAYGSPLRPQEMRSALLVAVSPDFFNWLESLGQIDAFRASVRLSDRLIDERYDLELILRFLILYQRPGEDLTLGKLRDFSQVLDDESVELAKRYPRGSKKMKNHFKKTFEAIRDGGGEDVFRKWDESSGRFVGAFLNTAFEVFAIGVGYHVGKGSPFRTDLLAVAKEFWRSNAPGFATGRSTEARLVEFIPKGRQLVAVNGGGDEA